MPMNLSQLTQQFAQAIAMTADENRVGCEDGPDVYEWENRLGDAIYDGLEAARDRQEAREFPDG